MIAPVAKPTLPDPVEAGGLGPKPEPPKPPDGDKPKDQPGAVAPEAMKPTAAKKPTKVIQKTKPTRRLQPGDLVCGACGEGNPPARKFCSRCGENLSEAVVVKKKFWQKLIPKRKTKALEAGARPGQAGVKAKRKGGGGRKVMQNVKRAVGLFAVLFGLAFAFLEPVREFTNRNVVEPVTCRWHNFTTNESSGVPNPDNRELTGATTEAGSDLTFLSDRSTNGENAGATWYGRRNDPNVEILFVATWTTPQNITAIGVHNGDSENFNGFGRPSILRVVFQDKDGARHQGGVLELTDSNEFQGLGVQGGANAVRAEVTLDRLIGLPANNPVIAVEDIHFLTTKDRDCSAAAIERRQLCGDENDIRFSEIPECDTTPTTVPVVPDTLPPG